METVESMVFNKEGYDHYAEPLSHYETRVWRQETYKDILTVRLGEWGDCVVNTVDKESSPYVLKSVRVRRVPVPEKKKKGLCVYFGI